MFSRVNQGDIVDDFMIWNFEYNRTSLHITWKNYPILLKYYAKHSNL